MIFPVLDVISVNIPHYGPPAVLDIRDGKPDMSGIAELHHSASIRGVTWGNR